MCALYACKCTSVIYDLGQCSFPNIMIMIWDLAIVSIATKHIHYLTAISVHKKSISMQSYRKLIFTRELFKQFSIRLIFQLFFFQ